MSALGGGAGRPKGRDFPPDRRAPGEGGGVGTAAEPAREGGSESAAVGGSAWGTVGGRRVSCRCAPSATMPGIDKLPIEETLEDSPQVRRGRAAAGGEGRSGAGRPPSLRSPRPQVPAPAQVGAAALCPAPRRAAPRAAEARPPAPQPAWACAARPRAARGVWDLGGRLRPWALRSRTCAGLSFID